MIDEYPIFDLHIHTHYSACGCQEASYRPDKVLAAAGPGGVRLGIDVEVQRAALNQKTVFLKAECDFKNRADQARFFFSLEGQSWTAIGNELKMSYTIPHFMGYRFGLFCYATKSAGGAADFDFFRVSGQCDGGN